MRSRALFGPLHADAPDHPKVWGLADALGIAPYAALGLCAALWARGTENGGTFRGGGRLLAHRLGWDGAAAELVQALVACRLLDESPDGWTIHGFADYGARSLEVRELAADRKRRARAGHADVTRTSRGQDEDVTGSGRVTPLISSPLLSSLAPLESGIADPVPQEERARVDAMLRRGAASQLAGSIPRGRPRERGIVGLVEAETCPTTVDELMRYVDSAHQKALSEVWAHRFPSLHRLGRLRGSVEVAFEHWRAQGAHGRDRWIWPAQAITRIGAWVQDLEDKAQRVVVTEVGAKARGIDLAQPEVGTKGEAESRTLYEQWTRLSSMGARFPCVKFPEWRKHLVASGLLQAALDGDLTVVEGQVVLVPRGPTNDLKAVMGGIASSLRGW